MSDVAWVTLLLVIVTVIYVVLVMRQQRQSEKTMLLETRYRLESDVTQIRITKALILVGRSTEKRIKAWEMLENREKQYSKTTSEVAKRIEKLEKGFTLANFLKQRRL
ncbi:hypothetical protein KAT45_00670 [Candidatus Aerophobetes bacterium]|nr:hypothetical protein [Candidatus Aerophobetes bacterium]